MLILLLLTNIQIFFTLSSFFPLKKYVKNLKIKNVEEAPLELRLKDVLVPILSV